MEDVLYAGGLLEGIDHVRRSCEVEMVKAAKPRGICAFADARKKSMNGFFLSLHFDEPIHFVGHFC